MSKSKNVKIYDSFSDEMQYMIIFAKAASINAKVKYIHPESFVIGILTMGENDVSRTLNKMGVDLGECLSYFKNKLSTKYARNENMSNENIAPSAKVKEICQTAYNIASKSTSGTVSIIDVFVSVLRCCTDIDKWFIANTPNVDKSVEKTMSNVGAKSKKEFSKSNNGGTALETFCVDMTKLAREGKFDPITSRNEEIDYAMTILSRRNKSNPILVGEPGVGKTAIVEGISQQIVQGVKYKKLKNAKVYAINMGMLIAGTQYRGDFEKRMQAIIDELLESPNNILFIDEIHSIIGAGSASGTLDASNMLKPALAKGIKCIGATTGAEYKRIFSKDGALNRRFEKILIKEPSIEETINIIKNVKPKIEEFHACKITDDAIVYAAQLCKQYKPEKNFPDKALDCIDTACAKFAFEDDITISADHIYEIISQQCNIPVEIIKGGNYKLIEKTEKALKESVIGQDHAIDSVIVALKNAYSGIRDPNKPIGSFVFGGASGTGKTLLSKELAASIFNKPDSFIRLDLSEYSEPHSVSKIIGSPPGYVGFNSANILSDKIKNNPYCVILLDELEKAHPDVIKLFLQILTDGQLATASGENINFKNTIIIMTGNFNFHKNNAASIGFTEHIGLNNIDSKLHPQKVSKMIKHCSDLYGPEFVNRIDSFVEFSKLTPENLKSIIDIELGKLTSRLEKRGIDLRFDVNVNDFIYNNVKTSHGLNATPIARTIARLIEPSLSHEILILDNAEQKRYAISVKIEDDNISVKKTTLKNKKAA